MLNLKEFRRITANFPDECVLSTAGAETDIIVGDEEEIVIDDRDHLRHGYIGTTEELRRVIWCDSPGRIEELRKELSSE